MTPPWKSPVCVCRWLPSSGEDFCDIYGEPLRDCLWSMGACHFDLGPWGAWRAGIGEMVALYLSGFDRSRHWLQQTKVIRTWHPGISEPLDAVGWSP